MISQQRNKTPERRGFALDFVNSFLSLRFDLQIGRTILVCISLLKCLGSNSYSYDLVEEKMNCAGYSIISALQYIDIEKQVLDSVLKDRLFKEIALSEHATVYQVVQFFKHQSIDLLPISADSENTAKLFDTKNSAILLTEKNSTNHFVFIAKNGSGWSVYDNGFETKYNEDLIEVLRKVSYNNVLLLFSETNKKTSISHGDKLSGPFVVKSNVHRRVDRKEGNVNAKVVQYTCLLSESENAKLHNILDVSGSCGCFIGYSILSQNPLTFAVYFNEERFVAAQDVVVTYQVGTNSAPNYQVLSFSPEKLNIPDSALRVVPKEINFGISTERVVFGSVLLFNKSDEVLVEPGDSASLIDIKRYAKYDKYTFEFSLIKAGNNFHIISFVLGDKRFDVPVSSFLK